MVSMYQSTGFTIMQLGLTNRFRFDGACFDGGCHTETDNSPPQSSIEVGASVKSFHKVLSNYPNS